MKNDLIKKKTLDSKKIEYGREIESKRERD